MELEFQTIEYVITFEIVVIWKLEPVEQAVDIY